MTCFHWLGVDSVNGSGTLLLTLTLNKNLAQEVGTDICQKVALESPNAK